jgi:hypothetical protein
MFSNNATIASDIWSVGKEPIVVFEITTWHASFTDFFLKLRRYTAIWKQLLLANDGACANLFENLSVNSLKIDLSNATTFKTPLF